MSEKDKDRKIFVPEKLNEHDDCLRLMIAESQGKTYRSYPSLAEASANQGVVILQGDDGGQIYLTCPAAKVKCSETGLQRLLGFLDELSWKDASAAMIYFEDVPMNSGVAGGMGGGIAIDDVWLHPELRKLGIEDRVRSFILGVTQEL